MEEPTAHGLDLPEMILLPGPSVSLKMAALLLHRGVSEQKSVGGRRSQPLNCPGH